MHPLSSNLFGSSGIKCVFVTDDSGNTDVGHIVKQLGTSRFLITNGTVTKSCRLAQLSSDVSDLTNMPLGLCTMLVSDIEDTIEHVVRITSKKCSTIEGHVHAWHLSDATDDVVQIITPTLQPFQTVTVLAPLIGDHPTAAANGINANGDIIGYSTDMDLQTHAVIWPAGGAPVDLGYLPGGSFAIAFSINAGGDVVGFSNTGDGNYRPVVWPAGGSPVNLGWLTGGTDGLANSINDDGDAVGFSNAGDGFNHAVIWHAHGTPPGYGRTDLGYLPGGSDAFAYSINASGDIVGVSTATDGFNHAVIWPAGGAPVDLGWLPGGTTATAVGINASGDIVGYGDAGDSQDHAIIWPGGGAPVDLGYLPGGTAATAVAISDNGVVTGYSNANPWSWTLSGGLQALSLIPGSLIGFAEGNAINPAGTVIVGDGDDSSGNDLPIVWR